MFKIDIPYKSHGNKYIWDYMTQACSQINNINIAKDLDANEAQIDNTMYVVLSNNCIYLYVGLSNLTLENKLTVFCDVWAKLEDASISKNYTEEFSVFSFDIKKYNSVLSFVEDYQNRDIVNLYGSSETRKLYYLVSENNYVDLSPIEITSNIYNSIEQSFSKYLNRSLKNDENVILSVDSVDKNSFLLPFMSYRDFLNFAVFSERNISSVYKSVDNNIYYYNLLNNENKIDFYSKTLLRKDKFKLKEQNKLYYVPTGLWQVLVMLQHFKTWKILQVFDNIAELNLETKNNVSFNIYHIFNNSITENTVDSIDINLDNYELVGELHSNELFRLNKLYSNANRTCFFDFSTQTFTGNNYVFNDNKLDMKTVELENKLNTVLPLKISFTEIKHYIGSDLSQKNFYLRIYTDGVRVMLERWDGNFSLLECRIIFDHTISKKNQNLN